MAVKWMNRFQIYFESKQKLLEHPRTCSLQFWKEPNRVVSTNYDRKLPRRSPYRGEMLYMLLKRKIWAQRESN